MWCCAGQGGVNPRAGNREVDGERGSDCASWCGGGQRGLERRGFSSVERAQTSLELFKNIIVRSVQVELRSGSFFKDPHLTFRL